MSRISRVLASILFLTLLAVSVRAADPPTSVPLDPELRERCLAVLRDGLTADEFWPSMHAAEALTLAGHGDEVLAHLANLTSEDDQQRCGLTREAVRAGDRSKSQVLLEILDKPGSNGHTHAAESLFKVGEIGDGKKLRAALEQDDDPRLKLMAAAALVRGGHPAALDAVREKLAHPDVEIRKVAVWILGQLGTKSDIQSIRAGLDNETDSLARAYIVHSLALLGDARARRQLGENLASENPAIKTYAAEFAGHCRTTEFHGALVNLLDDPTLDVRVRAAQSLLVMSQPPQNESERSGLNEEH